MAVVVFDEGRFLLLEDLALDFLAFLVSEKKSISVVRGVVAFVFTLLSRLLSSLFRQEI